MGLDGISINQLRVAPENNSSELNNVNQFSLNQTNKVVGELSQGQRINPDDKNQNEGQKLANNFSSSDDSSEESDEENNDVAENIEKYDLSDNNKYILKLDEESNNILIIEKASQKIIQRIDAGELSHYVLYLSNSQGSIVNRKF